MGCSQSRIQRKEIVSRCKARKRYLKQLVKARQSLSASHALYLRSLRATGSAFVHFSSLEAPLHHPPPLPSPQPPHLSPGSETTTWTSSALPPPPASSTWDFWDPFLPPTLSSSEEDWDDETATPPPSSDTMTTTTPVSELGMVATKKSKDLLEMINEINEYFIKAADSGSHLSTLLEISTSMNSSSSSSGKVKSNYECNLNPRLLWNPKASQVSKERDMVGAGSHSSTIERLYAWEKKLFQQVRNAESIKAEHEKKVEQVRKLEMKKAENVKTDKAKEDLEKLDSRLMVSSQAIESASNEIIKLRETQLYPQLIDLVKGMMSMWRSMYESHQVQTHIVQQLNDTIPSSTEPTSQIHRESTLRLELEIQQWQLSLCNLVKAQRDYIQSLTGWLRLSLFQFSKNPNPETSKMYSFCEEWQLAIDGIPDKVASQGINKLLTAVHGIVAQQADEEKQRKRFESVFKEFEKKAEALRVLESKNENLRKRTVVAEKKGKVEILKGKAEQEKSKYDKAVSETREMTVNHLHKGFPQVFQAMVAFSNGCTEAFESVYNQAKTITAEEQQQVTRLDKLAS